MDPHSTFGGSTFLRLLVPPFAGTLSVARRWLVFPCLSTYLVKGWWCGSNRVPSSNIHIPWMYSSPTRISLHSHLPPPLSLGGHPFHHSIPWEVPLSPPAPYTFRLTLPEVPSSSWPALFWSALAMLTRFPRARSECLALHPLSHALIVNYTLPTSSQKLPSTHNLPTPLGLAPLIPDPPLHLHSPYIVPSTTKWITHNLPIPFGLAPLIPDPPLHLHCPNIVRHKAHLSNPLSTCSHCLDLHSSLQTLLFTFIPPTSPAQTLPTKPTHNLLPRLDLHPSQTHPQLHSPIIVPNTNQTPPQFAHTSSPDFLFA